MVFSDTSTNLGILQRTRKKCRVDANQWPTENVVGSSNDCLDWLTGIFIGGDRRFQWDDTNHTKLPIGTELLVSGQETYSWLTDEQGNQILNLVSVTLLEIATNKETLLLPIDIKESTYDYASFGVDSGLPTRYDKIADNIIKLDRKPTATEVSLYKLKFYFQRTPSYFTAIDTTKEPGFKTIPHKFFVTWSSYDCADTLELSNVERRFRDLQLEKADIENKFISNRNTDEKTTLSARHRSYE